MYTHFLNQYKDRMNEVVAELEIVKKTIMIFKNSSMNNSSLCERLKYLKIGKSYTKNYLQNTMN
jgi:hypothetical protein